MVTSDFRSVLTALQKAEADEIYNLAGQTSVGMPFAYPVESFDSILIGTMNLLECIRLRKHPAKFYNAGSSEVFGNTSVPATEATPYHPRSPYATAKAAAHYAVANYREAYGLFACTGVLFNHESPLRPSRFVTSKIVSTAARIARGSSEKLSLGNVDIYRDWGYAPEYVEGMWRMLQADQPDDYVLATNETHTVQEFVEEAFGHVDLDWKEFVKYDARYERPAEVDLLIGDPAKAKRQLGWEPKVRFKELVHIMVDADLEALSKD
jgi:GDPmannose 4,6-dehydratase